MTRRSGAGRLPWGGTGAGGLYRPQRPGYGRPVVLGTILLAFAALVFFVLSRVCSPDECTREYCASSQSLGVPEGYELVSKIYEYNKAKGPVPAGNDVRILLPLTQATTDARNLSFHRYAADTKTWEPMGAAILEPPGKQVSATFQDAPPIIAVMRRLLPAGHVAAYIQHNGALHKDAAGRITILHTLDFAPAADGAITGELSSVTPAASFVHYPVITAKASDKGAIPNVTSILASTQSRSNHVRKIVELVTGKQLAGIDIAYFDLAPDQRTSFALFVTELAQTLHSQGKRLAISMPPPIKFQDRIDEGAYDWQEIGKAADILEIAPYRDQNTYRRDMPAILEYLADIVEPSKLLLTVTPYATEKAAEGIRTLTLSEAMSIATRLQVQSGSDQKVTTSSNIDVVATNIDRKANLSGVVWQPETATVAFTYQAGSARTVWLENFFSVGFKLEFIPRYRLGGVAVEDASDNPYLGNIWTALVPFIASGQVTLMQPNPKDLDPHWDKSGGEFEGGERAGLRGAVTWVTPADPGTYTITLRLSDGVYYFENEISVPVQPREPRTPGTPQATPVG